jgi:hypothetical protein
MAFSARLKPSAEPEGRERERERVRERERERERDLLIARGCYMID